MSKDSPRPFVSYWPCILASLVFPHQKGFPLCFHLPGFHFECLGLTNSQPSGAGKWFEIAGFGSQVLRWPTVRFRETQTAPTQGCVLGVHSLCASLPFGLYLESQPKTVCPLLSCGNRGVWPLFPKHQQVHSFITTAFETQAQAAAAVNRSSTRFSMELGSGCVCV